EAQAFITSAYKRQQAAELVDRMPKVRVRLMLDGAIDGYEAYEEVVARQPSTPLDEDRREGRDMLYSSGTTGRPKGIKVALSGARLAESADSVAALGQLMFSFTADSVYLSPAPLYHSAPLRFSMAFNRVGGTAIVMEHF